MTSSSRTLLVSDTRNAYGRRSPPQNHQRQTLAMFFYLGSKMGAQRTELRSEIGGVRIELGSKIEALGPRLDGLNARLDTHMDQRHAG